jgi:hypothetical protein
MIAAWNDAAEVSVQTSDLPMLYTHGLSQLGMLWRFERYQASSSRVQCGWNRLARTRVNGWPRRPRPHRQAAN